MSMILKGTLQDLVALLEDRAQDARNQIGKTRTKLESNELKGQVYAFNEAVYYVKAMIKGQEETKNGSANEVEPVASGASDPVPAVDGTRSK